MLTCIVCRSNKSPISHIVKQDSTSMVPGIKLQVNKKGTPEFLKIKNEGCLFFRGKNRSTSESDHCLLQEVWQLL